MLDIGEDMKYLNLPKKYKAGVYIQYKDNEPEVVYITEDRTITKINILTDECPEYLVLPNIDERRPFSKYRAGDYDYKIGPAALNGIDNPTLVLTGTGKCLVDWQYESKKSIKLILSADQSLYKVYRTFDDWFDYQHEKYYLVAGSNLSGEYGSTRENVLLTTNIGNEDDEIMKVSVDKNYTYDPETQVLYPTNDLIDYNGKFNL